MKSVKNWKSESWLTVIDPTSRNTCEELAHERDHVNNDVIRFSWRWKFLPYQKSLSASIVSGENFFRK